MLPTFLVVDDHDITLQGTQAILETKYAASDILIAQSAEQARHILQGTSVDLVLLDLSLPSHPGETAQSEVGLTLLREILQTYPNLNIVVLSSFTKTLIRLKPLLLNHEGGLAIIEKSLPSANILMKVEWVLQGLMCTPKELRSGLELKPEWLEVLQLAFQEGLQDQGIANRMNLSIRTVRNYWTRLQDALEVYPEPDKSIRIQTEIQARALGLID